MDITMHLLLLYCLGMNVRNKRKKVTKFQRSNVYGADIMYRQSQDAIKNDTMAVLVLNLHHHLITITTRPELDSHS